MCPAQQRSHPPGLCKEILDASLSVSNCHFDRSGPQRCPAFKMAGKKNKKAEESEDSDPGSSASHTEEEVGSAHRARRYLACSL